MLEHKVCQTSNMVVKNHRKLMPFFSESIQISIQQTLFWNVEGDASGIFMYYTEEPQRKVAGMLSMHVDTMVPKLARSYQDVACQMNERKVRSIHIHGKFTHESKF